MCSVIEAARYLGGSTRRTTARRRQRATRLPPDVSSSCDSSMVYARRIITRGVARRSTDQELKVNTRQLPGRNRDPKHFLRVCTTCISSKSQRTHDNSWGMHSAKTRSVQTPRRTPLFTPSTSSCSLCAHIEPASAIGSAGVSSPVIS